jgi:ABC-type transport system involved in multi-copper enzyme maturation permease subunit
LKKEISRRPDQEDPTVPRLPSKDIRSPLLWRRWHSREILYLGLLLFASPLGYWAGLSPVAVTFLVLVCLGGIVALVMLRGETGMVGPHFFYDIIRLARRGRSTVIRVLFLLVLLVALAFVYGDRFVQRDFFGTLFDPGPAISTNTLALLAEKYVFCIVIVQNLAVLILTPAYVASAVSEERERRTLDMLFTSHLKNREIVLGKLGARAIHMGGVLLAGLPVLSLSQLLGGVDMMVLLANFFNTGLNLLSVGSICILVSVLSRTVFASVMISYGIVLPFALCFSCFSLNGMSSVLVLWQRDFGGLGYPHLLEVLLFLILFHGIVSGTCLAGAISSLRSPLDMEVVLPQPMADPYTVRRNVPLEEQIVKRETLRTLPVLDDKPLLWKEMYLGGPIIVFSPAFWVPLGSLLIPLLVMFLFVILDFERHGRQGPLEGFNVLMRFLLVLLAGLFCLGVGYRACASVVREKQQGTLDALLTLPVTRQEILQAKWLGGLYKGWGWAVFYVPILLFATLTGAIHVVGSLFLLVAPLIHGVFLANLGLFLSVSSRTVLNAQMKLALGILALFFVELLAAFSSHGNNLGAFLHLALNPVVCWYSLGFTSWDMEVGGMRGEFNLSLLLIMVSIGFVIYLLGAIVFWFLASHLFQSEHFRSGD